MSEENKFGRKRQDFDRPAKEMYTIKCADCGKEDQVPFKPDGNRPVYCRECYQKHRPTRRY